ncbi:hypothetical protein QBC47DRAFT_402681 [Echria macrotheca]|uniref:Uncharacterized protein n=1 Tax=Echria macrotheca TaxID=438768 RepID=A0AAJ0BBR7_9PEZI|nr:hypothetical protein QBC47DRAFT_402681 [Echria macrotheca]
MDQLRWATPQPGREMREKLGPWRRSLFSSRSVEKRPGSVYTEFMESDWEIEESDPESDIEIGSEIEDDVDCGVDDGENSPRISVGSGQPSFTTVSSYDEVQTPRSTRFRADLIFDRETKPVEGPRGPHLFHNSITSAQSIELQHALSLSPLTPKEPHHLDHHLQFVHRTVLPGKRGSGPFRFTDAELDTETLADWTPEMVAQWMLNANIELPAAERFVENDINGAILITLKFEDLKELGISSFGVRTAIWEEIHSMRNIQRPEPQPETDIEDQPDRRARREQRGHDDDNKPKRMASKARPKINDIISPLESVSIVGIEQMMPKPHNCKKGEKCAKWKRNQRMIEAFKKDHPFVDIEKGGVIMIAGNPGNPETAPAIDPMANDDQFRPSSNAVPSMVASSDVMGPGGLPPVQFLQEAMLQSIQQRDPQDNVRQFLDFQTHLAASSSEIPPTPPFEILPRDTGPKRANTGLRGLPKLSIPTQPVVGVRRQPASAHPGGSNPMSAHPMGSRPRSTHQVPSFIPSFREMSPTTSEEATPTAPYRFGTPFSEMDVPVTITEIPIARDVSQSVPPDMNYRHNPAPPRSLSRATIRRPSFPVLPALDENKIVDPVIKPSKTFPMQSSNGRAAPQKAPPRVHYPWTSAEHPTMERAIPPMPSVNINGRHSPVSSKPKEDMTEGDAISYQGLMKKRKTKMLRHEWHEHFFTLRGTRLAMHKDAQTSQNKTLEYIDIDDYAIACSSIASSKLNAAFKAMHIRRSSDDKASKDDVAAFSFQLIPQDNKGGARLKKRESSLGSLLSSNSSNSSTPSLPGIDGAVNGTGKTHHFAVKNRDERIDWMRELMLAKALKQKGEGFEVSVNGNMI